MSTIQTSRMSLIPREELAVAALQIKKNDRIYANGPFKNMMIKEFYSADIINEIIKVTNNIISNLEFNLFYFILILL